MTKRELKWLTALNSLAGIFSTCSKRQYAAVIINPSGRVIGFGYNGSPPGMPHCNQGHCPRLHNQTPNGAVYDDCIAQHAEVNALLWSDPAQRPGSTLIINGPPCFGCSKAIASSGISKLICLEDTNYIDWPRVRKFLSDAKIQVIEVPKKAFSL